MRVTSVGNCAACDEISFEFCTFTNLDCSRSSSNLSFQSKFIILVGKFSLFSCVSLFASSSVDETQDKR